MPAKCSDYYNFLSEMTFKAVVEVIIYNTSGGSLKYTCPTQQNTLT